MNRFLTILTLTFSLVFASCAAAAGDGISEDNSNKIACDYLFICYEDGDNNLVDSVTADMVEMAGALDVIGDNLDIRILTLFDGIEPTNSLLDKKLDYVKNENYLAEVANTRLFEIKPWQDTANVYWYAKDSNFTFEAITKVDYTEECGFITKKAGNFEIDMSLAENVRNLLDFAYKTYKPNHILLKLNDHGTGTASTTWSPESPARAVCEDRTEAPNLETMIGEDQLAMNIKMSKFRKVDVLHLDACLEASIETAYELKDCTDFFVGSPNLSYGVLWNYIIEELSNNSQRTPEFLGQLIAKSAVKYRGKDYYSSDITCSTRVELSTDNSPTYSFMDFRGGKVDALYNKLNKVINTIYESMDESTFISDNLTDCDDNNSPYYNANLSKYIQTQNNDGTKYTPVPVDYLIARDFSFLLPRNIHGWVGTDSDTNIIVPFEVVADEDPYALVDDQLPIGKMTSMFYNGTYTQLLDIGYLMDMFIMCTEYNYKPYSGEPIGDTDVTYSQFVEACKDVNKAISDLIPFSHRVNTSIESDENDDVDDYIRDKNFYNTLTDIIRDYDPELAFNHYGITICAAKRPQIEDSYHCYQFIGERPSSNPRDSQHYRGSCQFVKNTKWIDILDYIFPDDSFQWARYDATTDTPDLQPPAQFPQ